MAEYDASWDRDNHELYSKMYEEWEKRDWMAWLPERLSFPFEVSRKEDMDDGSFFRTEDRPFDVGHIFEVLGFEYDDDGYGIICVVKEGRRKGHVPLADVEVTSASDSNFWPVREYVVWFANR